MALGSILIDTNAYVAMKRGRPEARDIFQKSSMLGVNPIVIGELLNGFSKGKQNQKNRKELFRFLRLERLWLMTIDRDTAECYSRIHSILREKGRPIPENDVWIAASALQYDMKIFTYDSHFGFIDEVLSGKSYSELAK
ncbi:MAG: type II toxin-antitoxin system VapC family toxin [Candidatus Sumerlaeia bacterium]